MKKVIINTILIFLISCLIHNLYRFFPNAITLIFSPVNESTWEYLKLIFTSYVIFLIFKMLFFKSREKLDILKTLAGGILNIFIFLIIFLPIAGIFNENWIVTLIITFVSILITNLIILFFTKHLVDNKKLNNLMIIPVIIIYLVFTYFTFFPLNGNLFYDKVNNKRGINFVYY